MARLWFGWLLWLVLNATGAVAAGYDDFAQGLSAINRGDNDQALANFSSALKAGDLNATLMPVAYFDRARIYLAKRECALAAADLTAAIKAKPDYADAYLARASVDQCQNDETGAIADFTQAIALRPTPNAYAGRGRAHWNAADFAGAAADFAQAMKLAPRDSY